VNPTPAGVRSLAQANAQVEGSSSGTGAGGGTKETA
jgi:hypothetical protein